MALDSRRQTYEKCWDRTSLRRKGNSNRRLGAKWWMASSVRTEKRLKAGSWKGWCRRVSHLCFTSTVNSKRVFISETEWVALSLGWHSSQGLETQTVNYLLAQKEERKPSSEISHIYCEMSLTCIIFQIWIAMAVTHLDCSSRKYYLSFVPVHAPWG